MFWLLVCVVFVFRVLPSSSGFSQILSQTRYAGAVLLNESDATTSWEGSPENALGQEDGNCSTTTTANAYLYLGSFGFSIPSDAAIVGIEVSLKGGHSADGYFGLMLLKGGSRTGNAKSVKPGLATSCADTAWKSWGSATDLWGATWTPVEVNDPGFGVRIGSGSAADATRFVDAVKITVYYGLPSVTAPESWSPAVPRGQAVESGDLTVGYSYAPSGTWITLAVQSVSGSVPTGFKLWVKGPAQTDYVELDLTSPYHSVTIATGLEGSGSAKVRLKADAGGVGREWVAAVFQIVLVYTLGTG